MSNNFSYLEKISGSPPNLDQSELNELALLYAKVFAGEPWNEFTYCPKEKKYFGETTQEGQACPEPNCGAVLGLAYPTFETAEYIAKELTRPNAALFLLLGRDDDRVRGFSWGFSYSDSEEFANDKYKTPEMRIAINGLLRNLDIGTNGLWYLSESGIEDDPRYRGQGWSNIFHARRLEVASSLNLDAIQRTNCLGNMYRTSVRTMLQIMGPQTVPDPLTRELKPAGIIVNGVVDMENSDRVLFTKKA
jgi:hypothetical protein